MPRCLIPENSGVYYDDSNSSRKDLWDKYYTLIPEQQRQCVEIRNCEESLVKTGKKFNVNPKTIAKWKKREDTKDLPMGPKKIKSTVLSQGEEEAIVAFRKMTGLPLDDVLYSLQETMPYFAAIMAEL